MSQSELEPNPVTPVAITIVLSWPSISVVLMEGEGVVTINE